VTAEERYEEYVGWSDDHTPAAYWYEPHNSSGPRPEWVKVNDDRNREREEGDDADRGP
jgi:hypothetical protein